MSFKVHLIIIACIIIAVTLAWEFMHNPAIQAVDTAETAKPSHNISITHASWGLNCRDTNAHEDDSQDAFQNKANSGNKLREDNVLAIVSRLCNGNVNCDVSDDEATLGPDPVPSCPNKVLEIEYRCFSYDRPWNVKVPSGVASLHCDQPAK